MSAQQFPTVDAASNNSETYSRSIEPEPSVTITDQTFFGHGWQPLTITVLQAIWFMPQGAEFDVEDLVDWFRSLGWKSANGKPLGADAVRRELALIRQAGYIRAHRIRGEKGRVVGIHYEVSKRPRPTSDAGIRFAGDESETSRSHHVPPMTTHGESPHLVDDRKPQVGPCASNDQTWSMPGVAEEVKQQVAPCASNGVHPPHPPEEVDTSSPYPLTHTKTGVLSQREEAEAEFTTEDLHAAEGFLQRMRKPWNAGRATARKCAPRLLAVMRDQGWPAIGELTDKDRLLLEQDLTKNPGGVTSYAHVLPKRIADLSLYDVAARPTAAGSGPRKPVEGMCLRHPGFREDDCPPCAQAERERTQRGRSEPLGLTGEAAAMLARYRGAQAAQGAQQDTPAHGG